MKKGEANAIEGGCVSVYLLLDRTCRIESRILASSGAHPGFMTHNDSFTCAFEGYLLMYKYGVQQSCMLPPQLIPKFKSSRKIFPLPGWALFRDVVFVYYLLHISQAVSTAFFKSLRISALNDATTLPSDCPGWLPTFHNLFSTHPSEPRKSFSMSDDGPISVIALTISLVALVITSGQLLGQYFATADGYRRCQSSVMGPWAKHTRLSWRWRQFRFETYFTTPQITFLPDGNDSAEAGNPMSSTKDTMMIAVKEGIDQNDQDLFVLNEDGQKDEEVVCWLSLLQSLYLNRWKLEECGCYQRSVTRVRRDAYCPLSFGRAGCPRSEMLDQVPLAYPGLSSSASYLAYLLCMTSWV